MRRKLSKIRDSSPRGLSLKILVTGGAGFIGSAFVRTVIASPASGGAKQSYYSLVVVDSLTYAGDLRRLEEAKGKFKFYKCDICNKNGVRIIFEKERPDIVINFAAETHVDRSILSSAPFIETNIRGTQVILDIIKNYGIKKLIHMSTDEVYGETTKGSFSEGSPLLPNSPYAASKAAADLLIKSYIRTYNLPAIIIRPCNNYGPWQYPEKLIPVAIASVLKGGRVPVYARGENIREWLYVDDCVEGIMQVMRKGKIGDIYNLGSGIESKNIHTVKLLLKNLGVSQDRFKFVQDRPGHDIRYRLNSKKISDETGWKPKVKFPEGIKLTVNWYLRNRDWLLGKK